MADKKYFNSFFFGFEKSYEEGFLHMHDLHKKVAKKEICDQLMLLEHNPTITLTRQYLLKSILTSENQIKEDGIDVFIADRGGDATFHGPGQIVGYPIINLGSRDIISFVRKLEIGLKDASIKLGVKDASIIPGFTGIWLFDRKLIAIGVGLSHKTTKHGFAFNLSIDYSLYQKHIIPCGLKDKGVINLKEALAIYGLELPNYSDIIETVSKCLKGSIYG